MQWHHQPHDCLLSLLFRRKSKETSKIRVTGLCAGNSTVTNEFPAQRASNAENVSIWWHHHINVSFNVDTFVSWECAEIKDGYFCWVSSDFARLIALKEYNFKFYINHSIEIPQDIEILHKSMHPIFLTNSMLWQLTLIARASAAMILTLFT